MEEDQQPGSVPVTLEDVDVQLNTFGSTIRAVLEAERIKRAELEESCVVWKNAYRAEHAELEDARALLKTQERDLTAKLREELREAKKELAAYKTQDPRVVCLIDGDGNIFSDALIARGEEGGSQAAKILTKEIRNYMATEHLLERFHLWVYVFVNKKGLIGALGGGRVQWELFDSFVQGFNAAAERFIFVDVGTGKEAADAKIKTLLQDHTQDPQTHKVIFGGCHDNGYVTVLRSIMTAGHEEKLTCLTGFATSAVGIENLNLPTFQIPNLFRREKITNVNNASFTPAPVVPPSPARRPSKTLPSPAQAAVSTPSWIAEMDEDEDSSSVWLSQSDISDPALPAAADGVAGTSRMGPLRPVDRSLPLSKQRPNPPCTLYYLAQCKYAANKPCKYAHDFDLKPNDKDEMRRNAHKSPCPAVNKNKKCLWSGNCLYGHKCPHGPACKFNKNSTCKFKGADMHVPLPK